MHKIIEELVGGPVSDDEFERFSSFCRGLKHNTINNKDLFMKTERVSGITNIKGLMSSLFEIELTEEYFNVVGAFFTRFCRSCLKYPFNIANLNKFPCKACRTELQVNCFAS